MAMQLPGTAYTTLSFEHKLLADRTNPLPSLTVLPVGGTGNVQLISQGPAQAGQSPALAVREVPVAGLVPALTESLLATLRETRKQVALVREQRTGLARPAALSL